MDLCDVPAAREVGGSASRRRRSTNISSLRETWRSILTATGEGTPRRVHPVREVHARVATFAESAKRRVALGLIIGELARTENLQPKPAEVRAMVEQEAQTYESPAEVVKWFYMQPQRLQEMEGAALEANVVKWVLSKARVADKDIAFDELMGAA